LSDRPATERSERPHQVTDVLLRAGLELIAEEGFDSVSVRALARRTHYSASTVGYHATPMRMFLTRLWQHVASDLLNAARPGDGDVHWSERSAANMLRWARQHPHQAAFFVTFSPERLPPHRVVEQPEFRMGSVHHAHRLSEIVHFLARRLQSALELALATPQHDDAVRLLAGSIHADWHFWTSGRPVVP
jgi:AcrR family transcriptional regulator